MVDFRQLLRGDLQIKDHGPTAYVWSSFAHYGVRALLGRVVPRDTERVMQEYNADRFEYWKPDVTADEYIWGNNRTERWVVLDGKVVRGTVREVRERTLPRLRDYVRKYSNPGDTVIEFGAGAGRNLAYLSRELPDRTYVGFELTPRTVEDARAFLGKHGLKVQMIEADMTKPPAVPGNVAVCYSVRALEQLPGTLSRDALENMARMASRAVVCFEPIRELYPRTVRGLTSRLRQRRADYLKGLPAHARDLGLKIVKEELMGLAEVPFNEISELVIETR